MCVCVCVFFFLQAQDLYQLIEGQNASLCKLREMTHRNQLTQAEVKPRTSCEARGNSKDVDCRSSNPPCYLKTMSSLTIGRENSWTRDVDTAVKTTWWWGTLPPIQIGI